MTPLGRRMYDLKISNMHRRYRGPQSAKDMEEMGFTKDEIADLLKWLRKNSGWAWAGDYPKEKPLTVRGVTYIGDVPNYYLGGALGAKARNQKQVRWMYDFWGVVDVWVKAKARQDDYRERQEDSRREASQPDAVST
jgi:hypothetical protein